MTGQPCPLCGGTRYIENIPQVFNDITYLFNPFGVMIIVIILETFIRIFNFILIKKNKITDRIVKLDMIYHFIIFISFILYEILYFIIK